MTNQSLALSSFARLRGLLEPAGVEQAWSIPQVWEPVVRWFSERAPVDADWDDVVTVEIAYQSGTDSDTFPVVPPAGLSARAPWMSVGFLRSFAADREHGEHGLDLWFEPDPEMLALRSLPEWDTGNLLGFDFACPAGDHAQQLVRQPLVHRSLSAFTDRTPAAALLVATWLDEPIRLR